MLFLLLAGCVLFYLLQHIIYRRYWNAGLDVAVDFETRSAFFVYFSYFI